MFRLYLIIMVWCVLAQTTTDSNLGIVHLFLRKSFSLRSRGFWLVLVGMGSAGFMDLRKKPLMYLCACLALCHSSRTESNSDSFSARTTWSIVRVPIMMGTLWLNSLPPLMTRATLFSSYEGILGNCTWIRTYPIGSV